MNKVNLLAFVGIVVAAFLNIEVLDWVEGQPSMENSSNLTNPNNPTLKLDALYNKTS
jgi:hypothetical protein